MSISYISASSADAASGTDVTYTHGLTIQAGDVLIASVHANLSGNTVTDANPSYPFTSDHYEDSTDSARHYVFSRVAGSSEPDHYHFTLGSSTRWAIVIAQFRGVDSTIWDVTPATGGTSVSGGWDGGGYSVTVPSMTVNTAGACGLIFLASDSDPTGESFSNPTNGYANLVQETGQQIVATCNRVGLSAGATGTVKITQLSTTTITCTVFHCALKPATVGIVTSGLVAEYVGKLANGGQTYGTNSNPQVTTWDDLAGSHDGTIANLTFDSTYGWHGAGTAGDPYSLVCGSSGSSRVTMGDLSICEDQTFSYEIWCKATDKATNRYMVYEGNTAGSAEAFLRVNVTTGVVTFRLYNDAASSGIVTSTTDLTASGGWHHIVAICSATTMTLYVDNVSEGTPAAPPATPITIDYSSMANWDGSNAFVGTIAAVRIYDRALTAAEVAQNYAAGILANSVERDANVSPSVTTSGLVAEYAGRYANSGRFGGITTTENISQQFPSHSVVNLATLPSSSPVTKVSMYLNNQFTGHTACNGRAIIYANNAGEPGARIAYGPSTAIADNKASDWVDFPLTTQLAAGAYWIGVLFDSNAMGIQIFGLTTGGTSAYVAGQTYDPPVDPYPAVHNDRVYEWAINATYTALVPGKNVDPTSTWKDLAGAHDATGSGFAWNPASSGWVGSGAALDPYGVKFDTTTHDDFVTTSFAESNGSFSLEFWLKGVSTDGTMLMEHGGGWGTHGFRLAPNAAAWNFALERDGNEESQSFAAPTDNAIAHVVFTFDSSTRDCNQYINAGTPHLHTYANAPLLNGSAVLTMGLWTGYTSGGYPGNIFTFRYYFRALTAAEVARNYHAGVNAVALQAKHVNLAAGIA